MVILLGFFFSKNVFFYLSHLLDVIVFVCLKVSKDDSMISSFAVM